MLLCENWCAAGFSPSDFWEQSVATYNAAMRGAIQKRRVDHELAMSSGWWTEYFRREQKRYGPLAKYLRKMRSKPAFERAMELAVTFKSMAQRGLKIKVRKIPRG